MAVNAYWNRKRSPFSLMQELHTAALENDIPSRRVWNSSAFQILSLQDAVKRIQRNLRQPQGSEIEKANHNELLHQAVIGQPMAQEKVKAMISQWMLDERIKLQQGIPGMSDVESLFAEAQGLSVLEDLYKNKGFEEIQVVGTKVYFMARGKKAEVPHRRFMNSKHVLDIQQRLVLYGHARISEQEPFCHTYLYDGSRLTMKMPPFAAEPTITIRRYVVEDVSLNGMERLGTLNRRVKNFLELLIQGKANGIIAGDTGTGKTTLLNAFIERFPSHERIVTLESEFELRIHERFPERNVVALQEINDLGLSMSRAFPTILRETPDRIIIGEVRSSEVVDAIKACSRGHRGTWFTLHLSDPGLLKYALYTLYIESGFQLPFSAFEMQLGLAVDVLIFMKYLKNGTRVVESIHTISLDDRGQIEIRPMVIYKEEEWHFTGYSLPERLLHSLRSSQGVKEIQLKALGLYE